MNTLQDDTGTPEGLEQPDAKNYAIAFTNADGLLQPMLFYGLGCVLGAVGAYLTMRLRI